VLRAARCPYTNCPALRRAAMVANKPLRRIFCVTEQYCVMTDLGLIALRTNDSMLRGLYPDLFDCDIEEIKTRRSTKPVTKS
ncbi:hypothetical protein QTH97_23300, partial [Variovorax sp. J22R24]|uniref:hypothetical protein n=1 Tax=Variovorax gracilis TaxID=3053502 RepID=UPI002577270C